MQHLSSRRRNLIEPNCNCATKSVQDSLRDNQSRIVGAARSAHSASFKSGETFLMRKDRT